MSFSQIYNEILADENLTFTDMILLPNIINLDNKKRCTATNEYLAALCGICKKSVINSIERLENLGYIIVKRTGNSRVILSCKKYKGVFAKLFSNLSSDKDLTSTDKVIYSVIFDLDNDEHCTASDKYLADKCSTSKRTIKRTIKKLEDLGFISISYDDTRRITCLKHFETLDDIVETRRYEHRKRNPKSEEPEKTDRTDVQGVNLSTHIYNIYNNSKVGFKKEKSDCSKEKYIEQGIGLRSKQLNDNNLNIYIDSTVNKEDGSLIGMQEHTQSAVEENIFSFVDDMKVFAGKLCKLSVKDNTNIRGIHPSLVYEKLIFLAQSFCKHYYRKFGKPHVNVSSKNDLGEPLFNALINLFKSPRNNIARVDNDDIDKMIEIYMSTKFSKKCDYRFMHFASYKVWTRILKTLEKRTGKNYKIYPGTNKGFDWVDEEEAIRIAEERREAEMLERREIIMNDPFWDDDYETEERHVDTTPHYEADEEPLPFFDD